MEPTEKTEADAINELVAALKELTEANLATARSLAGER